LWRSASTSGARSKPWAFVREPQRTPRSAWSLLEDLVEHGLPADGNYLFVIDGAKALSKAIKKVFGQNSVISAARCTNGETCQTSSERASNENRQASGCSIRDERSNEARKAIESIFDELVELNESAAGTLPKEWRKP